jgi:hypothetical protein
MRVVRRSIYGSVSASYASSDNWQGRNLRNFALAGNLQLRHNAFHGEHSHSHQVLLDLGYLKFIDSLWVKHADRVQLNLLWARTQRKWRQSYTVAFNTQMIPNKTYYYDYIEKETKERKVGGFLNPFYLQTGYGGVFMFWGTSSINFAFATLKVNSQPRVNYNPTFAGETFAENDKAVYFMSYGFSIATNINKEIGKHLRWTNTSMLFGNGLDRDHVQYDITNTIVVKLWKYLQLRCDTRIGYHPISTYDIQFRQEFLIGFFYERNK